MINKLINYTDTGKVFLGRAIYWWLNELRILMPDRLRRFLDKRVRWAIVDIVDDELILGIYDKEYLEVGRGRVSAEGDTDLGRRVTGAKCILRLHGSLVTVKTFELPAEAENNLPSVLSFEIERQTPFLCSQIYFDCQITERHSDKEKIIVAVAIVRKIVLHDVLRYAHKMELFPKIVGLFSTESVMPVFKFNGAIRHFEYSRDWRNLAFSSVVILLTIAAVFSWFARQDERLASLNDQLTNAILADVESKDLQSQLLALNAKLQFLPDRYEKRRVVEILAKLTNLLPDDTWIYQLEIKENGVRMVGYSSTASSLITLLDSAPFIKHTKFTAPITKDSRHGAAEKFSLIFELEGLE